ncbi:MAG: hypothetical protein RL745_68 [Actinomycetota bacterium]|jgi:elongation factor Ts
MAAIAAADVKKLRDITAAGMMECKKALEEADGDFDKAIEILRVSGAAKAAKRGAERTTSNGVVLAKGGVLVELLCETDFVAKGADFVALAEKALDAAVATGAVSTEQLAAAALDGGTVGSAVEGLAAVIGEKIELGRVVAFPGDVAVYLHRRSPDLPPSVGVLVQYMGAEDVARGVAMQVAAMRPMYLTREDVPADVVETEKRIAEETARNEGKPDAAIGKIVEGRVNSYFKDFCLLEQASVTDQKATVAQVLSAGGTTVTGFARVEVGQG